MLQFDDALLVAQIDKVTNTKNDEIDTPTNTATTSSPNSNTIATHHSSHHNTPHTNNQHHKAKADLMYNISNVKADMFFYNGQPVLAACCHLAGGDTQVGFQRRRQERRGRGSTNCHQNLYIFLTSFTACTSKTSKRKRDGAGSYVSYRSEDPTRGPRILLPRPSL